MLQDPNQPTNNQPPAQGGNPLDQLEELIKSAQNKTAQATGESNDAPGSNDGTDTQAPQPAELDTQKQMDEINKLKLQKAEEEKILIEQQKELMKQVVAESPQTQKRLAAKKEEIQQQEADASTDGYEIRQLSRTKIKKENIEL